MMPEEIIQLAIVVSFVVVIVFIIASTIIGWHALDLFSGCVPAGIA